MVITEHTCYLKAARYLLSTLETYTWAPESVEVTELPSKGKGLKACFEFHPGETIFEDRPLLRMKFHEREEVYNMSEEELTQTMERFVVDLCPSGTEEFYDLQTYQACFINTEFTMIICSELQFFSFFIFYEG